MAFQNLTTNVFRFPFWQMVDNSAEQIYDLGSQAGCDKLERDGYTVFTLISMHMDTVPTKPKMGICLPRECDKDSVKRIEALVHRLVQPYCAELFIDGIMDWDK